MAIQDTQDKSTGKASYFTYRGIRIPIFRINIRVTRTLADCTDSSDYDANADMIGPTQLPVSAQFEGTIEGVFRFSTTPQTLFGDLFRGVYGVPCTFGTNQNSLIGTGFMDIADYTQDMPINDTIRYSCTVRSNGLFTIAG